jgi:hypothetical protein
MSPPRIHYQIGAPALIHCEKIDEQSSFLQVPGHKYPRHGVGKIGELIQRRSRLGTRWYYSDEELDERKRRKKKRRRKHPNCDGTEPAYNKQLQQNRVALLAHHDVHRELSTRKILSTYASSDRPYGSVNLVKNILRGRNREPKLEMRQMHLTRKLSLQRLDNSDPAYLAPFGYDALDTEDKSYDGTHANHLNENLDKSKLHCLGPRPWQGNCLLCLPCPCPNCRSEPSWCLVHPKGFLMDTLCVSNLILPNGKENAGHIFTVPAWQKNDHKRDTVAAARRYFPNELCLDEMIVEIQQSGTWDFDHPDCIFVVRTATHISVVNVSILKPDLSTHDSSRAKSNYDDNICWGNYVLKEHTRLDLRSLVSSTPSYRPISLACHPKYGNAYTSARFAFLSYAENSGDQNVIHQFTVDGTLEEPSTHPISSLRRISSIDFTGTHPMCLWCAASSYVRPALVSEVYFKQYPLGFGTSLYSVDLRTNSSVFQWSPSAQEMKPEGVHSISGILTDWDREHTVWVTSKSAGKTWELDSRMPLQAVNSWSISSDCDVDSVSFPQRGPHGDPILLTKIRGYSNGGICTDSNMILTMDTAPASFGFQLLQRPRYKPRFQTESLECTSIPHFENHNQRSSIATTSVFGMPARDPDLFCCGMAGFRTPLKSFVLDDEITAGTFRDDKDSHVLCTMSMTNKGDIFCHSLLEASREVSECKSFPGLPAGTAAIPLPKELDGKINKIEHKCWKPTGGMNLKVFWTNQYPTSRDALLHIKPTASTRIHLPTKDASDHLSYKAGVDEEPYPVQIPPSSGIRIAATPGSEFVNVDGVPLMIPKKSADKTFATRLKFRTPNVSQDSNREDIIDDTWLGRRSDLTPALVDKVSNTWDFWENLDDDSSSEE